MLEVWVARQGNGMATMVPMVRLRVRSSVDRRRLGKGKDSNSQRDEGGDLHGVFFVLRCGVEEKRIRGKADGE